MTKTNILLGVGFLVCGLALLIQNYPQQNRTITLDLYSYFDSKPLKLNQGDYPNPGGEGTFSMSEVRFYLSNLTLFGEQNYYQVANSYHLIRFDEQGKFTLDLPNAPLEKVTALSFGIGVDPAANASVAAVGDLDPNSRMAWSWEVGYKFILLEGSLSTEHVTVPLVYHVGYSENYRIQRMPVTETGNHIQLKVDFARLFNAKEAIDMQSLSSVKFDREDARNISLGYLGLLQNCVSGC